MDYLRIEWLEEYPISLEMQVVWDTLDIHLQVKGRWVQEREGLWPFGDADAI